MSDTSDQAEVPEELTSESPGSAEETQELSGAAGAATPARDEPAPNAEGAGVAEVAEAVKDTGGTMPG